jgi:hypothetical protein
MEMNDWDEKQPVDWRETILEPIPDKNRTIVITKKPRIMFVSKRDGMVYFGDKTEFESSKINYDCLRCQHSFWHIEKAELLCCELQEVECDFDDISEMMIFE